jgi:hypothetical protein
LIVHRDNRLDEAMARILVLSRLYRSQRVFWEAGTAETIAMFIGKSSI